MRLTGCQTEALAMSHDLQKNHGTSFYVPTEEDVALGLKNVKKLDVKKLALVVRDYLRQIKDNQNIEIEFEPIDLPQGDILGACGWVESEDKFRIYYDAELNDCWKRFVICKELMQLYIDAEGGNPYTQDQIIDQIKELFKARNIVAENNTNYEFSEGVSPEIQALIMSIDLMVCPENRLLFYYLNRFVSLTNNNLESYDLALMLKYPEFVIKLYRKYIEKSSLIYGDFVKNDDFV
jgi:hypothetical protein